MSHGPTVTATCQTQGRGPTDKAARSLFTLLRSSEARQLLLQPPPACPVAAEAAVVHSIGIAISSLYSTVPDSPQDRTAVQVLDTLLKHETAKNVGALAAWLQQQPQQVASGLQQLAGQQQSTGRSIFPLLQQTLLGTDVGAPYYGCIWAVSSQIVLWMLEVVCDRSCATKECSSPTTCSTAVRLTQQLEDSGACTEPVFIVYRMSGLQSAPSAFLHVSLWSIPNRAVRGAVWAYTGCKCTAC
jgi:hypothetical protein